MQRFGVGLALHISIGVAIGLPKPRPPAIASWFAQDVLTQDLEVEVPPFLGSTQPLYLISSPTTGDLYVLGTFTAGNDVGRDLPLYSADTHILSHVLWIRSSDADPQVWRSMPIPADVLRLRATVDFMRMGDGVEALCVIGGFVKIDSQWLATGNVVCTVDEGETWKTHRPISIMGETVALAGSSLVQGPFGTFLVGGQLFQANSVAETKPLKILNETGATATLGSTEIGYWYSGVLRIDFDTLTGRSIQDFTTVTTITPMAPRLWPAAVWSWEKEALYIAGGVRPESFVGAPRAESSLWRVSYGDVANVSAWIELPPLPFSSAGSEEREILMFEVLATENGRGKWKRYPGAGCNASAVAAAALAAGDSYLTVTWPALAFSYSGFMYMDLGYGEQGWLALAQKGYPNPLPLGQGDGPFYLRSQVVSVVRSPAEQAGTLQILGVGGGRLVLGTGERDRSDEYAGLLVAVFPFGYCDSRCLILDGLFSLGCSRTPYVSQCQACPGPNALGDSTFCEPGVERQVKPCGVTQINGHPQPETCVTCKACTENFYVLTPCRGANETICSAAPPTSRLIVPTVKTVTTSQEAFVIAAGAALLALIVSVSTCIVRSLGGRTARGNLSGLCPCVPLCPSGLILPVVSKEVRNTALILPSSALALAVLLCQVVLVHAQLSVSDFTDGLFPVHSLAIGVIVTAVAGMVAHTLWLAGAWYGFTLCAPFFLVDEGRATIFLSPFTVFLAWLNPRTVTLILLAKMRSSKNGRSNAMSRGRIGHNLSISLRWARIFSILADVPSLLAITVQFFRVMRESAVDVPLPAVLTAIVVCLICFLSVSSIVVSMMVHAMGSVEVSKLKFSSMPRAGAQDEDPLEPQAAALSKSAVVIAAPQRIAAYMAAIEMPHVQTGEVITSGAVTVDAASQPSRAERVAALTSSPCPEMSGEGMNPLARKRLDEEAGSRASAMSRSDTPAGHLAGEDRSEELEIGHHDIAIEDEQPAGTALPAMSQFMPFQLGDAGVQRHPQPGHGWSCTGMPMPMMPHAMYMPQNNMQLMGYSAHPQPAYEQWNQEIFDQRQTPALYTQPASGTAPILAAAGDARGTSSAASSNSTVPAPGNDVRLLAGAIRAQLPAD